DSGEAPALRNLMRSEPDVFNSSTNASSVACGFDEALNALFSAPAINTDERPAGSVSSTSCPFVKIRNRTRPAISAVRNIVQRKMHRRVRSEYVFHIRVILNRKHA